MRVRLAGFGRLDGDYGIDDGGNLEIYSSGRRINK